MPPQTFSNSGVSTTEFFPIYEFMKMFNSFDRKRTLMLIDDFIKKHYGSYKELVSLTFKDLSELRIAIESKEAEEQLANYV